jgi:hypothetical protein
MSIIPGLGGLVEVVAQAELAFVEAECLRADDRAAEAEDASLGEGVEQRAGGRVDAQKTFRAQDADRSRARGLRLSAASGEFAVTGQAGADFVGILADIGLAHLGADAKRVVPVDFVVAGDSSWRPAQIGDGLVFQGGEEVGVGGVGDRGMAADHVQRRAFSLSIDACSTNGNCVEHGCGAGPHHQRGGVGVGAMSG